MLSKKLEKVPTKPGPQEATRVRHTPGESYKFVDYDLLSLDPKTGYFYGNWRDTADLACKDKKVDQYVDRRDMLGEDFAQECAGSKDGIYRFTIK